MSWQWSNPIEAVLLAAALLLLVPASVLFCEVLLACLGLRAAGGRVPAVRSRLAILMPAHDEAAVIGASLRALQSQLQPGDRLLVVADNCRDETAAIARQHGAEVIERSDARDRGKGFALAYGMRHLAADPPEIVVIVDADCQVTPGSIDLLADRCAQRRRPVQALYLMFAPEGAGPLQRLAEFAWLVRNQVRPLGLHRLGGPCQLMGSGMAFPWTTLARANLATGHIVEDLKLGLELAAAGEAPQLCPQARVTSFFPGSEEGIRSQRRRWEHGHLSLLLSAAPRLFLRASLHADLPALALALDLAVPPLALLLLLGGFVWLCSALLAWQTGAAAALIAASLTLALLSSAVLMAWVRFGRKVLSLRTLALGAAYAAAKVPLYARFLYARQLDWVRSRRSS